MSALHDAERIGFLRGAIKNALADMDRGELDRAARTLMRALADQGLGMPKLQGEQPAPMNAAAQA